jgi:hypothetical protein
LFMPVMFQKTQIQLIGIAVLLGGICS